MTDGELGLVFESARLSVELRLMNAELKALQARRDQWRARHQKLEQQLAGTEVQALAAWIEKERRGE